MQARGSRAVALLPPQSQRQYRLFEYRCCACLTPSQQKEAGVHSGVCVSTKVKRWHGEATFVPCKQPGFHEIMPRCLRVHVCVYMCVYVCVRVCVC